MNVAISLISLFVYFLIGSLVAEADKKVCEDSCRSYYMFLMILWPIIVVSVILACLIGVVLNVIDYFREGL